MRSFAVVCVLLAACTTASAAPMNITGAWRLQSIAGQPALTNRVPTLTLGADGHANGSGGCNAFGASYTRTGDTLTFSRTISTMMACVSPGATSDEIMQQEHRFLSALNGGVTASEPEANVLVLTPANGDTLRFIRR
jgi:heat shock protein HslJ